MNGAREIRRLRYLQAMGLPAFVAHRPLPGAAPTRKLLLKNPPLAARAASGPEPGAAAPGRTQSVATGSATATQKSAPTTAATERAAALRESLQPAPQAKIPPSVPQRRSGPRPAQPQTQRFSLAAMLCADRLWLEELEDALLARDQVQLVGALARALLHPEPLAKKPVVTQFDWPLHANQQLDLGPDEAAASLQGFLLRQLEENRCVELVCLGEAAAERLRGLRLPCALRRLPSSRDVLENPRRKPELWAALRN